MSLSPKALDALLSAGATADMIVAVVKAELEEEAQRRTDRREGARQRKQKQRASMSHDVTRDMRDILPLPPEGSLSPRPPILPKPSNPILGPPIVPQNRVSKSKPNGDFGAFWAAYPLKIGKGKAEPAYDRALRRCETDDPSAEILAGLSRVKPSWDEPDFIPHPTTWLNRDGWLDQPIAEPIASATGPPRFDLAAFEERRARSRQQFEDDAA